MMPQTSANSVNTNDNKENALKDDGSDIETNKNDPENKSESQLRTVTPAKDWPKLTKVYKMSSKPRGEVLIIDIQKFTHPDLKDREGSEIDTQNLKELFTQLDFNITVHKDLKGNKMRTAIRKFSEKFESVDADMCIVAILSHGSDTGKELYASDGVPVSKMNILEKFNNVDCEDLRYKPKFFIFQSCQGNTTDKGIAKDDLGVQQSGNIQKNMTTNEQPRKDPSYTDMIIAHSTVPGYVSNRNKDGGCWFIQCLCDIFREEAADTPLDDMLDQVAER